MMGSLVDEATKGIIPRLCDTLFEMMAEVSSPEEVIHLAFHMIIRIRTRSPSYLTRWKCLTWRFIVRKSKTCFHLKG